MLRNRTPAKLPKAKNLSSRPGKQQIYDSHVPFGGGRKKVYVVGGGGADVTPDAFSFNDRIEAAISTLFQSGAITITGLGTGVAVVCGISGAGFQYSKNGGGYTAAAGTVQNGDTIELQGTSSNLYDTPVSGIFTAGGVSDTWSITTQSDPSSQPSLDFSKPADSQYIGVII